MKINESKKRKYQESLFHWKNSVEAQNFYLEADFVPVKVSEFYEYKLET